MNVVWSFFGGLNLPFVTTEAVISEVIYFLQQAKTGKATTNRAIERLFSDIEKDLYEVHFLKKSDLQRIKNLMMQYADQRLDYADLSLVIDLKLGNIITIDRNDFQKLRWCGTKQFNVIQPVLGNFHKT